MHHYAESYGELRAFIKYDNSPYATRSLHPKEGWGRDKSTDITPAPHPDPHSSLIHLSAGSLQSHDCISHSGTQDP